MEETIREFLNGLEFGPIAWILLFLASGIEYVFPPFPGDTVTLAGAFLVFAKSWSLWLVFLAVNAGALVGMWLDYEVGRALRAREGHWRTRGPRLARIAAALDTLVPLFQRRATLYLVINRFLPSIRGLFFVAAGMASVPRAKVLTLGLVSALLWNTLLFTIGGAIGKNWEDLSGFFSRYNRLVWALLIAALVFFLVRRLVRRSP